MSGIFLIEKKLDIAGNSKKRIYRKNAVGKVKVINGSRVVLSGTRRDNCVYSLDGHAMAGELNASVEEKDSLAQVWHKRLGHISEAGLQVLEKQGLFGKESLEVRTDNGLEFCNREFEQLCIESGIARHLTCRMPRQIYGTIRKDTYGDVVGTSNDMDVEDFRHVTRFFNESVMYKDTLKDFGAGADKSIEELLVEVELQRFNNHTPEEDQIHQEDGDDEDAGDHETDQTPDLIDYQLARDRERRTRTKPLRFRDESNMAAYAFAAAEEEDTHEPLTYQEAVACEDSSKWKVAMLKKRMDFSVEKENKTWELQAEIGSAKSLLKKEFDMKELREAKKILGMEIVKDRSRKILRVSQSGYVSKILNNFRIDNGKSIQMPLGGHFKLSLKDSL
ncbi:retrovirus-related pol polyprotein from transposon TNT 1-94 [Tanacetum coccineum]